MHKYIVIQSNIKSVNGLINKFLRSCKCGVRTGRIVRCKGFGINGVDRRLHDYMRLGTITEIFDGNIDIGVSNGDIVKFYGGDKVDVCKPNCEPIRIERIIPDTFAVAMDDMLTRVAIGSWYLDFRI